MVSPTMVKTRPVRLFKNKKTGKFYTKAGSKKIYLSKNVLQHGKFNLVNQIINKIFTKQTKRKKRNTTSKISKKKPILEIPFFLPGLGNIMTKLPADYWTKQNFTRLKKRKWRSILPRKRIVFLL